jgi:hypothetical protein
MKDTLPNTLKDLLRSGTESNPALNVLLADYTRYHVVLVLVGGLFLLILVALSVLFWRRFRRAQRTPARRWAFERKTYFAFGLLSVVVAIFLALVVAANVSTVLSPREGFKGSIGMIDTSRAGAEDGALNQSFNGWLRSGSTDMPSLIQGEIDDRLSWQRPKAVLCTVLLLGFAGLSALIWRTLIRRFRMPEARWRLRDGTLLVLGLFTVALCLLLMLMVMGNTQGSLAPISLTLFFG